MNPQNRASSRQLKLWNGRGGKTWKPFREWDHFYVCAKSRRDAAVLLAKTTHPRPHEVGPREIGQWDRELKEYYSECWGNDMDGVVPERGVWATATPCNRNEKPTRVA